MPPTASLTDTVLFFLDVALPTIGKGLFLRRPGMVAMAQALDLDRRAVRRMQALREHYGAGPLLLRMPVRNQALLLTPDDARRVLRESPDPFALASSEKQSALGHFQPRGVLVSNAPQRAVRRRINEEALDAHRHVHHMAAQFLPVVQDEAARLLTAVRGRGNLAWDDFIAAWFRIVRRVMLGAGASDDHALTDMLAQLRADANWGFLKPKRRRLQDAFFARLETHLARAEEGSLAGRLAQMGHRSPEALHQVPQWLFAFDAAGMATYRALALLAAHPGYASLAGSEARGDRTDMPFLRATLLESVRLWPTTPVILRQTTRETAWGTGTLPPRSGVLLFAPFFQRDERLSYADRFAPELWLGERSQENAALVPFSDGPGFCPGRELVLLLGSAMLAELLTGMPLRLERPLLDARRRLPGTLSPFALRFAVQ
ncbi:cytochrome P450 [Oxalobacteraceae bacterium OM1]|nr:cytochrome P450 [Oxalobacteraceae bacterium OM1]